MAIDKSKPFDEVILEGIVARSKSGDTVLSSGKKKSKERKVLKADIEFMRAKAARLSVALEQAEKDKGAKLTESEIVKLAQSLHPEPKKETLHGVEVSVDTTPFGTVKVVSAEAQDMQLLDAVLDLSDAKDKLARGGSRKSKIPQEHIDLARSIAAVEKEWQVHGYRKRVISRLLKEHGIDAGTESNLEKYYL